MIYLAVSIDVEPDCTPTWHYSNPLTFEGVRVGIKERLQPLFNKYGVVPTYLINNVVLEDVNSVNVFKTLEGQFELGTHLHPEFIEPQKTVFDYAGSKGEANCCFYPPEIEREKILNITKLFEDRFGYKPESFRAGRFSAGINTFQTLQELGYKVDTSVTPHLCWNDGTRQQPVDYRTKSEQPFFIGPTLLEVPITIVNSFAFNLKGNIRNVLNGKPLSFSQSIWLRPVCSSYEKLQTLLYYMVRSNSQQTDIVLNMMFHNVEVLPSLSPYTQSENDCEEYLYTLERFFELCISKQISFSSLSGIYDRW